MFESLERRTYLSATSIDGLLSIEGVEGKNKIAIIADEQAGEVMVSGVDDIENGTVFDGVTGILVRTFDGKDKITVGPQIIDPDGTLISVVIDAGGGKNRIDGGEGSNSITAGEGRNNVGGSMGDDVIRAALGRNRVDGSMDGGTDGATDGTSGANADVPTDTGSTADGDERR